MGLTDDKDFPVRTPVGTLSVRQCLIVGVIFRGTRISERQAAIIFPERACRRGGE
jgi:hypothetical protein